MMSSISTSGPTLEVQKYLGENVRIVLDDGRVIEGEFRCMDKDLNFLIGSAVEYHGMQPGNYQEMVIPEVVSQRALGSAMVPGEHIVKIFGPVK